MDLRRRRQARRDKEFELFPFQISDEEEIYTISTLLLLKFIEEYHIKALVGKWEIQWIQFSVIPTYSTDTDMPAYCTYIQLTCGQWK
jgi:hypothetical protein